MKIAGILLVAFGLFALLFGGFSFLDRDKVADFGRVEVERTERETFAISPVVGGAAIVVGALLLVAGSSRRRTIVA